MYFKWFAESGTIRIQNSTTKESEATSIPTTGLSMKTDIWNSFRDNRVSVKRITNNLAIYTGNSRRNPTS